MKKGMNRFLAAVIVQTMILSACGSEEVSDTEPVANTSDNSAADTPESSDEAEESDIYKDFKNTEFAEYDLSYDIYSNSEITYVENQPFIINGTEGKYTGDWKGDRPEGNGALVTDKGEEYSGEWKNGYLSGQDCFFSMYVDDIYLIYRGVCENNMPSGYGVMAYDILDESESCVVVRGDFGTKNDLMYFSHDNEYNLFDIGRVEYGEFISLVDNYDYVGMEFIPERDKLSSTELVGSLGWSEVTQTGEYFGQVNDSGIPEGYGYARIENNIVGESGSEVSYVHILGNWVNGEYTGQITKIKNSAGADPLGDYIRRSKDVGKIGEEGYYGYCTFYEESYYDPPRPEDGITIRYRNNDYNYENFSENYALYDDGLYRTPYEISAHINVDGSSEETFYRYIRNDVEESDFGFPIAEEGFRFYFDRYMNVTDLKLKYMDSNDWVSSTSDRNINYSEVNSFVLKLAVDIGQEMNYDDAGNMLFDPKSKKDEDPSLLEMVGQVVSFVETVYEHEQEIVDFYNKVMQDTEEAFVLGDYDNADMLKRQAQEYYRNYVYNKEK